MNHLQKSLRANAVFSIFSGLTLVLFHSKIARLFGQETTTVFWIVGLILLYFTATIVYEIRRQRYLAVVWISIQDFLWVLGSIVLLVFEPFEISKIGRGIITVVALVVLYMGLNQLRALLKMKIKRKN
ncbi:hypothetical protein N9954_05755 [Maribacter sp.]|nr:hypothetical protein [Maribacter sp.]